jgi:hypothetical protein
MHASASHVTAAPTPDSPAKPPPRVRVRKIRPCSIHRRTPALSTCDACVMPALPRIRQARRTPPRHTAAHTSPPEPSSDEAASGWGESGRRLHEAIANCLAQLTFSQRVDQKPAIQQSRALHHTSPEGRQLSRDALSQSLRISCWLLM